MTTAYEIASQYRGQVESPSNSMLNDFLNNGGTGLTADQYAWCSRFMKQAAVKAGVDVSQVNDMARSWLKAGQPVTKPQPGDVAVLSRGSDPSKGHVGFYEGANADGSIRILSGNHNDAVASGTYPAERVLGYRRLAEAAAQPVTAPAFMSNSEYGRESGPNAQPSTMTANAAPMAPAMPGSGTDGGLKLPFGLSLSGAGRRQDGGEMLDAPLQPLQRQPLDLSMLYASMQPKRWGTV